MSEHCGLPPDYRHTRATECARLIGVSKRRRLVAQPRTPHLHCAARAVLQDRDCQCWGSRGTPLAFLWGIKRGYSLRKENTPFVSCSASGAAFPAPRKGKSKGGILFGKRIPPLSRAAPAGAAFPAPRKGESKRDTLFGKRIPPLICLPFWGTKKEPSNGRLSFLLD